MNRRIIFGAVILLLCAVFGLKFVHMDTRSSTPPPVTEVPFNEETGSVATTSPVVEETEAKPAPHKSSMKVMAWIFPSAAHCSASQEYKDGRSIDVLKPEYFTVNEEGQLTLLTEAVRGCNGYSAANAKDIRAHSQEQFVTVSGLIDGIRLLTTSAELRTQATDTLVTFVVDAQFTGVEIDFEDYGNWDAELYRGYLAFLQELGDELHAKGKKLMVDVPPISGGTDQGYYLLTYADIAKTPADYIVVMAYDYQFDHGAGTPLAPTEWVRAVVKQISAVVADKNRIVIGIPSYAYSGVTGSFQMKRHSYQDFTNVSGFGDARRDESSFERIFEHAGKSYVYVDTEALDEKRAFIESLGVGTISVWSLGGNQWFSR